MWVCVQYECSNCSTVAMQVQVKTKAELWLVLLSWKAIEVSIDSCIALSVAILLSSRGDWTCVIHCQVLSRALIRIIK